MSQDVEIIIQQLRCHFEGRLETSLPSVRQAPQRLHEAMGYAVLSGGKRIRPLLAYASGIALQCDRSQVDPIAIAIELIHAYSLVHDDLPAMDDDDLRRGRPTCHKAFDDATAILAGDAIQARAFEVLACSDELDARCRIELVAELARACGSLGMAGGQAIDLQSIGSELDFQALRQMHELKTGALIESAVAMPGYLLGLEQGEDARQHLRSYGRCIGLAFQIKDDVLDVEGETQDIGKPKGSDQAAGKPTFPACIGLDASKKLMAELLEQARAELHHLDGDVSVLSHLAGFMIERNR